MNHFGHFLVTQELLPLVESASQKHGVATIVVLSSMASFFSYPEGVRTSMEAINNRSTFDKHHAYAHSKLANILFAQELAERVRKQNILVNSVHPGSVKTPLAEQGMIEMGNTVPSFLNSTILHIFRNGGWSPQDAALSQIYLAVGQKLIKEKITGKVGCPLQTVINRFHSMIIFV